MSSVSDAGVQSGSRRPIAIVLGIIGALFIILGIVYLAVPAGSLPSILGHTHPVNGHHSVRMAVCARARRDPAGGRLVRQPGWQVR